MFSNTTSSYRLCLKPSPVNAPYGLTCPTAVPERAVLMLSASTPSSGNAAAPFPGHLPRKPSLGAAPWDAVSGPGTRLQRHGLASLRSPSGFSLTLPSCMALSSLLPAWPKQDLCFPFSPPFILGSGVSADTGTVQGTCSTHPAASERSPSLPAPRRSLRRGRSCRR